MIRGSLDLHLDSAAAIKLKLLLVHLDVYFVPVIKEPKNSLVT